MVSYFVSNHERKEQNGNCKVFLFQANLKYQIKIKVSRKINHQVNDLPFHA